MDTVSLLVQIEQLQKENETLLNMVSIAAQQREKYAAIEQENKALKEKHRLDFAKQAMQAFLSKLSIDDSIDYDFVAKESFEAAKAMTKQINI